MNKWDLRFLDLADHISQWSRDPSTKVGAVVTDQDNRIVSVGYNGFPKGISDGVEKYEDRGYKYKVIVHGEMNAILFAQKFLKGCTLYTHPFMPCSNCASMIIQSGIKRVVSRQNHPERWSDSFKITKQLFNEAGVILDLL